MRFNRTAIAAVLTAAALTLPCAAWYLVGSRAVQREADDLIRSPQQEAHRLASRLADRLHGRLEAIRLSEARRPYYEYRNRYPDPSPDCACAPILDSPLSRGPDERFIWTHFEIDRTGRVFLPTIPEEPESDGELAAASWSEGPRGAHRALKAARGDLLKAIWKSEQAPPPDFSTGTALGAAASARTPLASRDDPPQERGVTMEFGDVTALVEPFRWYTVEISGAPRLVAMRTVWPPEGRRVQGFVVSTEDIEETLQAEQFPVRFLPADENASPPPAGEAEPELWDPLALKGVSWRIAVDAQKASREAAEEARSLRARFLRVFAGGTGLAALASLFVVGIVRQTERLARSRSQFAASAAHELRTPLAGLRVYGEMLAEDLGDPTRRQSYARQIAVEAERLGRVVSNVLGYTRLERGSMTVRPVAGDLGDAVLTATGQLCPTVEGAGARLAVRVSPDLPPALFDRDALFQIMQNLVDNAERYTRGGSDRTITVEVAPERTRRGSPAVRVSVIDRGPGVAAGQVRRLFRPFVRGTGSDAPAGLGLGLAIVGALVRAQDARITYEPNPDGGSIFSVTFRTESERPIPALPRSLRPR